jgi:hypothetical protein
MRSRRVGRLLSWRECGTVVSRPIAASGLKQTELNLTDMLVSPGKICTWFPMGKRI